MRIEKPISNSRQANGSWQYFKTRTDLAAQTVNRWLTQVSQSSNQPCIWLDGTRCDPTRLLVEPMNWWLDLSHFCNENDVIFIKKQKKRNTRKEKLPRKVVSIWCRRPHTTIVPLASSMSNHHCCRKSSPSQRTVYVWLLYKCTTNTTFTWNSIPNSANVSHNHSFLFQQMGMTQAPT